MNPWCQSTPKTNIHAIYIVISLDNIWTGKFSLTNSCDRFSSISGVRMWDFYWVLLLKMYRNKKLENNFSETRKKLRAFEVIYYNKDTCNIGKLFSSHLFNILYDHLWRPEHCWKGTMSKHVERLLLISPISARGCFLYVTYNLALERMLIARFQLSWNAFSGHFGCDFSRGLSCHSLFWRYMVML